ncbi:hypothetical protein B0G80_4933 [Paraburkholderia sp. BL6669N2]|nr:hypothetical protein B0G80_4933 [Paraburkholderia sp. BL6669N2]
MTVWRRVYISTCSSSVSIELPTSSRRRRRLKAHLAQIHTSISFHSMPPISVNWHGLDRWVPNRRSASSGRPPRFTTHWLVAPVMDFNGSGERRLVIGEDAASMTVQDCREAPPCVATEHSQSAFVTALCAGNVRRADCRDEKTSMVRRHAAAVDADCYRIPPAWVSCVACARLGSSSSKHLGMSADHRGPGLRAPQKASRSLRTACAPCCVDVTQAVSGRAFKSVGIQAPAVGVVERFAARPNDRFPDCRSTTDALEFTPTGVSH